jgi:hypothetical protein
MSINLRTALYEQIDPDRTYAVEFGGLALAKRMDGTTLRGLIWTVTDPGRITFQPANDDQLVSLVERSLSRLTA